MAFRSVPIRRKLATLILGTSAIALFVTCAAFMAYEFQTFRKSAISHFSTLGEVVAANGTAAVAFNESGPAERILRSMQAERHLEAACFYLKEDGSILAKFVRDPGNAAEAAFPARPGPPGYRFAGGRLEVVTPVVQSGVELGSLYLKSDLNALYDRLRLYTEIALAVIVFSMLAAYVLSRNLQQQIAGPITTLADAARAVSDRRDYSVRAPKLNDDELGILTDAFNHMLEQIERKNAELEERVRERTTELEAANRELDAFCQSVSHDLHTPLRAIAGFADILVRHHSEALRPEIRRYVDLIRDGTGEMSQLIRDLLAFSRLGRQPLLRETVDLERLFREVFAELEADYRGRRVDLRIGALPRASGDPALLRQVVVNLLSNALKYTRPRDPAVIEIGAEREDPDDVPVYFVRDNGVGFDMRYSDKLFEVFQRLHQENEFEGSGVGLATVRRVVERHGGRIWAKAAPEAGATFYFTLAGSRGDEATP